MFIILIIRHLSPKHSTTLSWTPSMSSIRWTKRGMRSPSWATKNNWFFSAKTYFYAMAYNSGALTMFLGAIGAIVFWLNRKIFIAVRVATVVLFAPLVFNILALYLGHSVLFVPDLVGNTWFNVRYGIMMMPSLHSRKDLN